VTPKQKLLACLTRAYLLEIALAAEVPGSRQMKKEALVSALARKGSVHIETVLNQLSLADLRVVCQSMGVEDARGPKAQLVARLLGPPRPSKHETLPSPKDPPDRKGVRPLKTKQAGTESEPAPKPRGIKRRGNGNGNGNGEKDKSLESWIWDAACSIRGAQDAPKYKDFILPLVFTKRLCDVFDDELNRIAAKMGSREKAFRLAAMGKKLKKALMHKLFTEGTRGEPQKETEFGLLPANWEVASCDAICESITVGVVVRPKSYYVPKGIPAFRSFNVREDRLNVSDLVFFTSEDNDNKLSKSKLHAGDVLIVRTGYPGTSCIVPKEYEGSNCIDLVVARPKEHILSDYLSRFFNSSEGKKQSSYAKHGLAQQHLNVGAVKKVRVPVPPKDKQADIVTVLEMIDLKIARHQSRKEIYTYLFRTLLDQLMTAQIRVNDIDLSELGIDDMPAANTQEAAA